MISRICAIDKQMCSAQQVVESLMRSSTASTLCGATELTRSYA